MQKDAVYDDVTREVFDFLCFKKEELAKAGIYDIIIDPGFGFAKTIAHNFEILNKLEVFKLLEAPLLLGLSRKSMVHRTLGISAEEALNGSTVLHTIGIEKGADIIRTHDVKEAMEAILLLEAMAQKK
jgi:dihydropteroate synthase